MEYFEAIKFLFNFPRSRIGPGTDSTSKLLDYLENPHIGNKYIHVTGSNGKGSTSRMISSILMESNLKVGLYTSPHLSDFRERILVNDQPIPHQSIQDFIDIISPYATLCEPNPPLPTFFEVTTALALWHFNNEDVDVAVIEVGIGGKHDATSVITPVSSAVTNVSLEHTDILGTTVEEIARDKATIASKNSPLVTAATGAALAEIKRGVSNLLLVGESGDFKVKYKGSSSSESFIEITAPNWAIKTELGLIGRHQGINAGIAAAICDQSFGTTPQDISTGLKNSYWPGRFEIFSQHPLIILDGAHNPAGCMEISKTLSEFEYQDLFIVFGALGDKDHEGMISSLPPSKKVFVTKPNIPRAAELPPLINLFTKNGSPAISSPSIDVALNQAISSSNEGDCILVTGSLYTIREARQKWANHVIKKATQSSSSYSLKTKTYPVYARQIQKELLKLGGSSEIFPFDKLEEELTDIILSGSPSQFKSLLNIIGDKNFHFPTLVSQLSSTINFQNASIKPNGFPWENSTILMGILNLTPDSFYDGGNYNTKDQAITHAISMVESGANIIDVGGESTRPGAVPISSKTELNRILPAIQKLSKLNVLLSVDTRKANVAEAAINAGANIINDVSGLSDPQMRFIASDFDVPIVLTHSINTPVDPTCIVNYNDVVEEVISHLSNLIIRTENAGLDRSKIIIDPGIGFGKTPLQNFEILRRLDEFKTLGCPILVGHSHKSLFSSLKLNQHNRLSATIATTAMAVCKGANIIRAHDVSQNLDAIRVAEALKELPYPIDL